MTNRLYYGDNLDVLRDQIADESVDLIYLDPPFNSDANYNVLFRAPAGKQSEAQVEAFQDTWHWGDSAARAFDDVIHSRHTDAATMLNAMRSFLGENDMMAYLAMMAARLIELHRVLKPTGSLYLHCDPTASHYLKILLDSIFGPQCFRNEICWQRTTPKGHAFTRFPSTHDVVFAYGRSDHVTWHAAYVPHRKDYVESHYGNVEPETGRRYMLDNCLNPNPDRPNLTFEWNGLTRVWRWTRDRMQALHDEGRLVYSKSGMPRYKRYLDEMAGTPVTSVWTDIPPINSQATERLGYPTQKPLALLERIIQASSNEGDVVLDPFCGCGTAVHAAEKLKRKWIGIDITHLSISLIERRLKDAFADISFEVLGTPKDFDGARDLAQRDKYQFQWWAVSLVDAVPQGGKKKGMDRGIDGIRWVRTGPKDGDLEQVLVSVKGGENVGAAMVRDLKGTVEREKAAAGLFITLVEPTREMKREAAASGFFETPFGRHPKIQIFTIQELLAGMKPDLPAHGRREGFRQAPREKKPTGQQGGLDL
jgi:site-specific DNA-methyltransferase (adenine-specific)